MTGGGGSPSLWLALDEFVDPRIFVSAFRGRRPSPLFVTPRRFDRARIGPTLDGAVGGEEVSILVCSKKSRGGVDMRCAFVSSAFSFEDLMGVVFAGFVAGRFLIRVVPRHTARAGVAFGDPLTRRFEPGVDQDLGVGAHEENVCPRTR